MDNRHTLKGLLRSWPWAASVIAAAAVNLLIGAFRHFDFTGIRGFSTTNYGWIAFALVGGVGLSWRLAKRPAGWWLPLRALVAPAMAFIAVFVAATLMALIFLPGQSLLETFTTDAPGRALWLSITVTLFSCTFEAIHAAARALHRRRRQSREAIERSEYTMSSEPDHQTDTAPS